MKYCVSSRVDKNVLAKADEIKFQYRDRKAIPDYFEEYPDANIILYCPPEEYVDWDEMNNYKILGRGKFMLALSKIIDLSIAKDLGYNFFYAYPITSLYELNAFKSLGVSYAKIGIPLFFNIIDAKNVGIPIRVVPNVAYDDGLPRENGIFGKWIRPEDLETLYNNYVDAVEFEGVDPEKEALLYRVYAEDHEWRRSLDLLLVNFNYPGNNRIILSSELEKRLNCGHACQKNKCHICEHVLILADIEKLAAYKKEVIDPELKEDV